MEATHNYKKLAKWWRRHMCRIRLRLQLGFVRSLIEFSPRGAGSPEAERSAETQTADESGLRSASPGLR